MMTAVLVLEPVLAAQLDLTTPLTTTVSFGKVLTTDVSIETTLDAAMTTQTPLTATVESV